MSYGGSRVLTVDTTTTSVAGHAGLAIFWNAILFLFLGMFFVRPFAERRLLRDGKAVVGQITGRRLRKGKSYTQILEYTYTDRGGEFHYREMTVRKREFCNACEGDPVTVFCNPLRPQTGVIYKYSQYAVRDRYGQLLAE